MGCENLQGDAPDCVYISPHLDDVVYSCGGTIYSQVQGGANVLVVTVCTGSPENDALTDFALELKARWGGNEDPVGVRRNEDLAAMRVLGARGVHLGYLDCVYRQDAHTGEVFYPTVKEIFGEVHPAEHRLHRDVLVAFLDRARVAEKATVYAPLGAGHHVDHIIVRRMALLLAAQGCRVLFYEDYPYAGDAQVVGAALGGEASRCWQVRSYAFGEAALKAKAEAAACYVSQISTFWSNAGQMYEALRTQALAVGGGGCYAENHWQLSPECLQELKAD
jgi:LmbE family N-acetylglucosaminyl deacetylase